MGSSSSLSLWQDTLGDVPASRVPLSPADLREHYDVVIMGAGYTGLWTAVALTEKHPDLKLLVLDKERVGFGASGRNGGWVSSLFPTSPSGLIQRHGLDQARAMRVAMVEAVDSLGAWAKDLGIQCDFVQGGTTTLARNQIQLHRAQEDLAEAQVLGVDKLSWRAPEETLAASAVAGAVFNPACARIHPGKLVQGLAEVLDDAGVRIAEATAVISYSPGRVVTQRGEVTCDVAIDAMEGYRSQLRQHRRDTLPLYSLMIATNPLPDSVCDDIGLNHGETFADYRSLVIYGQRTADNRIAFGGRGAPYHLGSRIKNSYDLVPRVFRALEHTLKDFFPQLADATISHRWGGVLGVPRDWHASVTFDSATGLARAGGYVGDGVGLSHLAGLTLADVITDTPSARTTLPMVNHVSPRWEPEPLRYLGATAAITGVRLADYVESRTGKPSIISRLIAPLTGH